MTTTIGSFTQKGKGCGLTRDSPEDPGAESSASGKGFGGCANRPKPLVPSAPPFPLRAAQMT